MSLRCTGVGSGAPPVLVTAPKKGCRGGGRRVLELGTGALGRYLWFEERDEIMRQHAGGLGTRAIGRELGGTPPPSAVSSCAAPGPGATRLRSPQATDW